MRNIEKVFFVIIVFLMLVISGCSNDSNGTVPLIPPTQTPGTDPASPDSGVVWLRVKDKDVLSTSSTNRERIREYDYYKGANNYKYTEIETTTGTSTNNGNTVTFTTKAKTVCTRAPAENDAFTEETLSYSQITNNSEELTLTKKTVKTFYKYYGLCVRDYEKHYAYTSYGVDHPESVTTHDYSVTAVSTTTNGGVFKINMSYNNTPAVYTIEINNKIMTKVTVEYENEKVEMTQTVPDNTEITSRIPDFTLTGSKYMNGETVSSQTSESVESVTPGDNQIVINVAATLVVGNGGTPIGHIYTYKKYQYPFDN